LETAEKKGERNEERQKSSAVQAESRRGAGKQAKQTARVLYMLVVL